MSNVDKSSYFNPRSPHGERRLKASTTTMYTRFQSTLPARGATRDNGECPGSGRHFNPRSPHGERLSKEATAVYINEISIHAPRTGSDVIHSTTGGVQMDISIHAPRTGSDWQRMTRRNIKMVFQSTLPARGATVYADANKEAQYYFNPRSPHGERRLERYVAERC